MSSKLPSVNTVSNGHQLLWDYLSDREELIKSQLVSLEDTQDDIARTLGFTVSTLDITTRMGVGGRIEHLWMRRPKPEPRDSGKNNLSDAEDQALTAYLNTNKDSIKARDLTQSATADEAHKALGFFVTQGNVSHRMGTAKQCLIQFTWPGSEATKKGRASNNRRLLGVISKLLKEIQKHRVAILNNSHLVSPIDVTIAQDIQVMIEEYEAQEQDDDANPEIGNNFPTAPKAADPRPVLV